VVLQRAESRAEQSRESREKRMELWCLRERSHQWCKDRQTHSQTDSQTDRQTAQRAVVLQWCYSGVTVVLQWCYLQSLRKGSY
jgi:hypothetical protein